MVKFSYTAIMVNGSKTKGIIEANNLVEARNQLKSKKLRIVDIKEKNDNTFSTRKKGKKLKPDTISHFCRQFSIIMSSGINSLVGLETLAKRTENKVLANEMNRIVESVKKGSNIADAMLDKKSKFPRLLGAIVAKGEDTGTLEDVLSSMAVFYEREHKINQKIKNASTYPAIVAGLSFVMLFLFTSFIIPQMMESIMDVGGEVPFITKFVMSVGQFMSKFWWLVLIMIMGVSYVLLQYINTPLGRIQKDKIINNMIIIIQL